MSKWCRSSYAPEVSNFFINIMTPLTAANQLLQGKPKASISDLGRFAMNTTLGVGRANRCGLAGRIGEKFGGPWGRHLLFGGSGPGPYVVLPFFRPFQCAGQPRSRNQQFCEPHSRGVAKQYSCDRHSRLCCLTFVQG